MGADVTDRRQHHAALEHLASGHLSEVATICTSILSETPDDWLALRMLGVVRIRDCDFDEAVRLLTAALHAAPADNPYAATMLSELAEALLGRPDVANALRCAQRAVALAPHDANVVLGYGNALIAANRHGEALQRFRQARSLDANLLQARFNEALAMMALGMWPQAWGLLEARLSIPSMNLRGMMPDDVPHWRGEVSLAGKTILLHAEQGLGDTLQYVRYLPRVAALGGRVMLRVQPTLRRLLDGLPGADRVIGYDEPTPPVDFQCPLMSLPLVFGTTVTSVPAPVPYLRVPPDYLKRWRRRIGPGRRRRIGVAWSGRPHPPLRSIPLATLAPLLAQPDLEIHSLQKDMPDIDRMWLAAHDGPVDHSRRQKDFMDAAALIAQMDLVVSIDTSLAHLAGALGKPVWIMLPYSVDGRWLLNRADTPWYPTARLFRQARPGDWDSVAAAVVQALSD